MKSIITLGTIILLALASPFARAAVTITVPGTSDPWLAGMPEGSTASWGDTAPEDSPVEVTGLQLTAGDILDFRATGGVAYDSGFPLDPPDGNSTMPPRSPAHDPGAENGLPDCRAPYDSLLGVFLGPNPPNLLPTPAPLDFANPSQQNYTKLAPALKQIFFIGNGLTSDGTVQKVVVPDGTTRLFLGTLDGYGWHNNVGSFTVVVTVTKTDVPAPTFQSITRSGNTLTLTWLALGGRSYQLQFTTDLSQPNWTASGSPILASQTTASAFDVMGLDRQRFYSDDRKSDAGA